MTHHQPATRWSLWSFALIGLLLASGLAQGQGRRDQPIFSAADRAVNGAAFQLSSTNRAMALDVNIAAFRSAAAPQMTITNVPLAPGLTVDLELTEWNIIEDGANLVFGTERGEEPITIRTRLYRGRVKGESGSDVFLAFADKSVMGHVTTSDKSYELSTDFLAKRDGDALPVLSYPTDALPNSMVGCGVTEENLRALTGGSWVEYDYDKFFANRNSLPRTAAEGIEYAIPGAWEGDKEYVDLFGGDRDAAAEYMVQLVAEVSSIYERDVQTQLTVAHMKIWTSSSAEGYPYKEGTVMSVALRETKDYWNQDENKAIPHAIAHTFSGKPWQNPIGIAYLDVLCPQQLNNRADPQGAFSAITLTNSARDRRVVAHETGHNVGANHTHHCGWPVPGGPKEIDRCAPAEGGSCFTATEQQVGTIMSYCSQAEMKFHPLVIDKMKERIGKASCLIAAKKLLIQPNLVIFGNEIQNVARDTILETFFSNIGQFDPIEVTDVVRTGDHNDEFEILEGMPPFTLQPNETKKIKVRFKASITEGAQMHLVYQHNGLNPPVEVTFEGYASDIRPILTFRNDNDTYIIDWGDRFIGTENDTLQEVFYQNLGVDGTGSLPPATLYITDTRIEGPDKLDFQIIEGTAPIQLGGLENAPAGFRFAPRTPGQKEAWLVVESNSQGVPGTLDSLKLTGGGTVGPILQLAVPDLLIDFGDVESGSERIDTAYNEFFYNAGLAGLTYYTGLEMMQGEEEVFSQGTFGNDLNPGDFDPLVFSFYPDQKFTLGLKQARFIVQATPENDPQQLISDDTLYFVGNIVAPSSVPDNIEPDEFFYVTENPTAGSEVSFFLAPREDEVGEIFIASLLDVNGREVWRQVGQFRSGAGDTWRIDTKDQPSGAYYIRVSTTDGIRARKVMVAR